MGGFFDALTTPEAIDKAATEWAASLPVTRDEVLRACRYAARGFDDAEAAKLAEQVTRRADKSAAAENLERLEKEIAEACAKLKVMPDALMCETQSRIHRLCDAAAVELGCEVKPDEARLRADYDLTYREIVRRLRAEKDAATAAESAHNAQGGQPCQ